MAVRYYEDLDKIIEELYNKVLSKKITAFKYFENLHYLFSTGDTTSFIYIQDNGAEHLTEKEEEILFPLIYNKKVLYVLRIKEHKNTLIRDSSNGVFKDPVHPFYFEVDSQKLIDWVLKYKLDKL